jgi:hypothetical protein
MHPDLDDIQGGVYRKATPPPAPPLAPPQTSQHVVITDIRIPWKSLFILGAQAIAVLLAFSLIMLVLEAMVLIVDRGARRF